MREYLRESIRTSHVICITEGAAEEVIIQKLFEENKLVFSGEDKVSDEDLIRVFTRFRAANKFEQAYLRQDYGDVPLTILRILDSKKENFKLKKIYNERIKNKNIRVFDIRTMPEIEILMIINEGWYDKFTTKSQGLSASNYCKTHLKQRNIKSKEFVGNYFYNIDILLNSIEVYKRKHNKKENLCIADLLD